MARWQTDRLVIRNFNVNDWEALYEMIVQYQATEYAAYDQQWPTTQEEIQGVAEGFARGDHFLAVCLRTSGQFIGFIGLNPEPEESCREFNIGYIFSSIYQGRGYATEACKAVLVSAFGDL